MIKSRYRPDTPQDVRVEETYAGYKVTWSSSYCVDSYDFSYKMVGDSEYTNTIVDSNFAIISETLEICEDQTVTFTSAPDDNVSDRLEPVVEEETHSAVVRWKGSEKLSCIPTYQVQLCDGEARNR